jgi:uncharacterized protein (DUF2252 family)
MNLRLRFRRRPTLEALRAEYDRGRQDEAAAQRMARLADQEQAFWRGWLAAETFYWSASDVAARPAHRGQA